MSAPARQAPMVHVVLLVRLSRLCSSFCEATGTSGRLSAYSWSFGGILASPSAGVGGQPNYGVIPWLPEALRALWPFGRQRRTPSCYFFGSFALLFLVVSGTGSGAAGSVTLSISSAICWFSIHHCLLSEGIDVQIGSASLLLVQRLAVPGTCHNGGRSRR